MSIEFLENVSIAWKQTVLLCLLKDLFTQIVGTLKIACLLSVGDRFVRIPICLASLFQRDYCSQTVLSSRGEKREFAVSRVSLVSATQHSRGEGLGEKCCLAIMGKVAAERVMLSERHQGLSTCPFSVLFHLFSLTEFYLHQFLFDYSNSDWLIYFILVDSLSLNQINRLRTQ